VPSNRSVATPAGILLVYDITNEQSFKNIEEWLKNIEKHTSQPVNKILIGRPPRMPEALARSASHASLPGGCFRAD